ncbi:MAG: MgtC/SapB family protein [Planctomycetes bacterium]|nr:MgtC/SapB family protein [Planctomycetota bacterium]
MDQESIEIVQKILLSALFGGIIGFERELHGQAAGLRTHMVVACASCLIMLLSIKIVSLYPSSSVDPSRIASQAVTGIGFLGGAAVIKFGLTIRGLTTAACIWAACAVGLATGMSYYFGAIACTLCILIIISLIDKIEMVVLHKREYRMITITSTNNYGLIEDIKMFLKQMNVTVAKIDVKSNIQNNKLMFSCTCSCPKSVDFKRLLSGLQEIKGVEEFEIT